MTQQIKHGWHTPVFEYKRKKSYGACVDHHGCAITKINNKIAKYRKPYAQVIKPFREQWCTVLEILIVCAATDESIKTKGLSWESPQVLWLLALLLTSVVYFHHHPNPNQTLPFTHSIPGHVLSKHLPGWGWGYTHTLHPWTAFHIHTPSLDYIPHIHFNPPHTLHPWTAFHIHTSSLAILFTSLTFTHSYYHFHHYSFNSFYHSTESLSYSP